MHRASSMIQLQEVNSDLKVKSKSTVFFSFQERSLFFTFTSFIMLLVFIFILSQTLVFAAGNTEKRHFKKETSVLESYKMKDGVLAISSENIVSPCSGVWILYYTNKWYVKKGNINLDVDSSVSIYGCDGNPITLDRYLNSVKVKVDCSVKNVKGNIKYIVKEIQLICE
ncbi:hypothetical protein [Desulfovulcanus sp.]